MEPTFDVAEEIASVQVKVGGETHKLVLTKNYVSINCRKWIFREDTSFIPVNSIDSIFYGWKRYWITLVIALVFIVASFAPGKMFLLIPGGLFLALFWFYKPHLLLVRSTRESLGGHTLSVEESKKFIDALTKFLNQKN